VNKFEDRTIQVGLAEWLNGIVSAKHEALSSNPNTAKKKEKEQKWFNLNSRN
jgi:hypothetical protein